MICNQINLDHRHFCRPEFLIVKINLSSLNHKQSNCNSGLNLSSVMFSLVEKTSHLVH